MARTCRSVHPKALLPSISTMISPLRTVPRRCRAPPGSMPNSETLPRESSRSVMHGIPRPRDDRADCASAPGLCASEGADSPRLPVKNPSNPPPSPSLTSPPPRSMSPAAAPALAGVEYGSHFHLPPCGEAPVGGSAGGGGRVPSCALAPAPSAPGLNSFAPPGAPFVASSARGDDSDFIHRAASAPTAATCAAPLTAASPLGVPGLASARGEGFPPPPPPSPCECESAMRRFSVSSSNCNGDRLKFSRRSGSCCPHIVCAPRPALLCKTLTRGGREKASPCGAPTLTIPRAPGPVMCGALAVEARRRRMSVCASMLCCPDRRPGRRAPARAPGCEDTCCCCP